MRHLMLILLLAAPVAAFAEGGETIATAVVIPELPCNDYGVTCDNVNDYDEVCPFPGSSAPDVVYSYTPSEDVAVYCSLCDSSYDTKLYVYADSVGHLVACNDDDCQELQSYLEMTLQGGVTYYFVVDGYGTACGPYIFRLYPEPAPCVVECPPGSLHEGEPPCQEGYVDEYNSGCDGTGWTAIEAQQGGCAAMCGRLCGWTYEDFDADWYRCTAAGGLVTATVRGEFFPMLSLIYVADCSSLQYMWDATTPCATAILEREFAPGQEFWIRVTPYAEYWGLPESDYHLDVCGIQGGPTPAERTSWGRIKNRYR